jgi:hypothetical protein
MMRQPMERVEVAPGPPGPPRQVVVTPVDEAAIVAWDRPAEGASVTHYEVTPVYGWTPLQERAVTVDGSSASALVRNLANGTTYTVRVVAWHHGRAGEPAVSVPFEPNPPPSAPTSVVASPGEQSATVRWLPPAGGGPVERYRVSASPADGQPCEVPAAQTSALYTGLRNRCRYSFTVEAMNDAGGNVSWPSNSVWPGDDVPPWLFPVELAYLLLLGAAAFLYALRYQPIPLGGVTIPVLRDVVPPVVAGVPVSIPWFGALGAVMIGLYGVFDHSHRDWERGLNAWHVARPFTGAVLGTTGVVLFVSVIRAAGLGPAPAAVPDSLGKLVFFAIAFVVGFREETFRQLIKRVADLLVGPGQVTWRPESQPPSFAPPHAPPAPPPSAPRQVAAPGPGSSGQPPTPPTLEITRKN